MTAGVRNGHRHCPVSCPPGTHKCGSPYSHSPRPRFSHLPLGPTVVVGIDVRPERPPERPLGPPQRDTRPALLRPGPGRPTPETTQDVTFVRTAHSPVLSVEGGVESLFPLTDTEQTLRFHRRVSRHPDSTKEEGHRQTTGTPRTPVDPLRNDIRDPGWRKVHPWAHRRHSGPPARRSARSPRRLLVVPPKTQRPPVSGPPARTPGCPRVVPEPHRRREPPYSTPTTNWAQLKIKFQRVVLCYLKTVCL